MWELDHKEGWALKNWCVWTVVLEKMLESPLDCKDIKSVDCKGNQSWIFIGRTDAEAEVLIRWPLNVKSWLIREDPDAGKGWGRRRGRQRTRWLDGITDSMSLSHLLLEFEQAAGDGKGQRSLVCLSPWGCKELDMTEKLNWTESFKNQSYINQICHLI